VIANKENIRNIKSCKGGRKMETGKRFVNAETAAKLLGKTAGTLANDRFFNRGVPYIKSRGRVLYDLRDLQKHLEECKIYPQNN